MPGNDRATLPERPALAQDALVQVIASATAGDAWVTYTTTPTAVVEALRRGVLPAGATTPLLVTLAPLTLTGASDDELVRLGTWLGRGWVAAADLRAAGVRLLDVRVRVNGNRHARRAERRREGRR